MFDRQRARELCGQNGVSSAHSSWQAFWRDPPGQRFSRRHERLQGGGRHPVGRVLRGLLGVVLILFGLVFMVLPGPGFVPVGAGLALLASESRRLSRGLDRAELKLRGWLGRR